MTAAEVVARLTGARAEFDALVAAVPRERLEVATPGGAHSPKDIVVHITAYEDLIVRRLRASRAGETTAFDRDRDSWEAFNERIWAEAAAVSVDEALARAREVFAALLEEVAALSDEEIAAPTKATAALDPGWLEGREVWELIGIDAFDHYPMHFDALAAAGDRT